MNGQKIIEIALKEIGVTEVPPNSNKTKYGVWFGWDEQMWCGQFVSYCYHLAGYHLKHMGFLKGFAGCQTAYNYFVKNKELTTTPQPGDIVLFDWNNDKRFDHVGIFVKWIDEAKGIFESVEGNTSFVNDSNGGSVMLRKRNKSVCVFAHPKVLDIIK